MYQLLLSFDKLAGQTIPRTGGPGTTKSIISWKLKQKEVGLSQKCQYGYRAFGVVEYGPYKALDQLSGLSRSETDELDSPKVIISGKNDAKRTLR